MCLMWTVWSIIWIGNKLLVKLYTVYPIIGRTFSGVTYYYWYAKQLQVGLYRDDGLGAFKLTPRQLEKTKKTISRIFHEHGLVVTIEANKKVVDFLDVTLDLTLGVYRPYTKPNDIHLYVHKQSNQPLQFWRTSQKQSINDCVKILQMKRYLTKQPQNSRKPWKKVITNMNLNLRKKIIIIITIIIKINIKEAENKMSFGSIHHIQ